MNNGFSILPNNSTRNNDSIIKNYYSNWREFNKGNSDSKETFAMLYTSFKNDHLKDLDGGSLKLYLFFCFNANNSHGESWYSIQKIAEFFDVQTRTVDKWIKTLVDKELIFREQIDHRSSTTYLLPYSTTLMPIEPSKAPYASDSQELIQDLLDTINKQTFLFGNLIGIYHIFQWEKSKSNNQYLLLLTKRKNGVLTGHYYELKHTKNVVVSKKEIKEIYFFKSHLLYNNDSILGLALKNDISFKSKNFEALRGLLEQLEHLKPSDISENHYIRYEEK